MLFTSFVMAAAGLSMIDAIPTRQQKRAGGFTFFGVSEAGAEFGQTVIPGLHSTIESLTSMLMFEGVYGIDYTFPDT